MREENTNNLKGNLDAKEDVGHATELDLGNKVEHTAQKERAEEEDVEGAHGDGEEPHGARAARVVEQCGGRVAQRGVVAVGVERLDPAREHNPVAAEEEERRQIREQDRQHVHVFRRALVDADVRQVGQASSTAKNEKHVEPPCKHTTLLQRCMQPKMRQKPGS